MNLFFGSQALFNNIVSNARRPAFSALCTAAAFAVGIWGVIGVSRAYFERQLRNSVLADNLRYGQRYANRLAGHDFSQVPVSMMSSVIKPVFSGMVLPPSGGICVVGPGGSVLFHQGVSPGDLKLFSSALIPVNTDARVPDQGTVEKRQGVVFRPFDMGGKNFYCSVFTEENNSFFVIVFQDVTAQNRNISVFFKRQFAFGGLFVILVWLVVFALLLRGRIKHLNQQNIAFDGWRKVRKDIKKANREKDLYYQALYNSTHGMMLTDDKGQVVVVNPAFEKLYGFSSSESKGHTPDFFSPSTRTFYHLGISVADREDMFRQIWESVSNPGVGIWEGEMPQKQKDGSVIWVRMLVTAIKDDAGKITHYMWLPMDITAKREDEFAIRMDIYRAIADVAERRDDESGEHVHRIGFVCKSVALKMQLSEKFCEDIEVFATLHDIGKVGILDRILQSRESGSKEDQAALKTHTEIGYEILSGKPTLEMAADIAYCHHENFDGSGYPRGTSGQDIPMSARIVRLADFYDTLRSNGRSHAQVLWELKDSSGVLFDPEVVKAFCLVEKSIEQMYAKIHVGDRP